MLLFQKIFSKRNYIYKLMAFKRKEFHKEENCLNCGYPLVGPYCANCGQKAFLHKDSFWHMAAHFVSDYFHYDNKFWRTIKTLFSKPGLVTLEFNEGKRGKYLNPIQLYIFVTTVFFLVIFSFSVERDSDVKTKPKFIQADSVSSIEKRNDLIIDLGVWRPQYKTIQAYDSAQLALPSAKRDHFFKTFIIHRVLTVENETSEQTSERALAYFKRNIPKLFFVLLPLFAFFLKILYPRRSLYYVDHLIFSIHFHIVCFLLILIFFILAGLVSMDNFDDLLSLVILLGIGVYLFISLRKVYHSSVAVTLLKQFLLFCMYLFSLLLVFIVMFIFALLL
jgi:hypothetical protein